VTPKCGENISKEGRRKGGKGTNGTTTTTIIIIITINFSVPNRFLLTCSCYV
jgi:hypothetical protein